MRAQGTTVGGGGGGEEVDRVPKPFDGWPFSSFIVGEMIYAACFEFSFL